jgi:hypothetical protein
MFNWSTKRSEGDYRPVNNFDILINLDILILDVFMPIRYRAVYIVVLF